MAFSEYFVGLLVVTHPVAGALGWTLLFASFFAVIDLFRFLPWAEWRSGFWFLGLAAGVSLILRGWSYVMFALAIYNLILLSSIMQAA